MQDNSSTTPDLLSKARWEKVIYLKEGDLIAVSGLEPSTSNLERYVLWAEIESIEYIGKKQVYDIAVEGNRNFFGNGILAHNTYLSGNIGIGTTAPATKLDVTGLTINTDATNTVMAANFTGSLTKNDANAYTFAGLQIKPTLNTGGSNADTTFNVLSIDTTNTAVIGLTTNLLKAAYGGSQKLLLDSSGNLTLAGTTVTASSATISASAFSGSGASLTGIPNTALSNDTIDFDKIIDSATLDATWVLGSASTTGPNADFNMALDTANTGADYYSPYLVFRGNEFTDPTNTELDMAIRLTITDASTYQLSFYNDGQAVEIGTLDESGNLQVDGTITATGNINSSGGALQTNGVTRIDNSGNVTTDRVTFGNSFYLDDIDADSLGLYDSVGALVVEFDEAE